MGQKHTFCYLEVESSPTYCYAAEAGAGIWRAASKVADHGNHLHFNLKLMVR